jgi:cell division transport system permease protein
VKAPFGWLRYAAASALRGLRSSPVTSSVAVVTVAVTLLLSGAFSLLLGNMQRLVERFGEEVKLAIYLEADLADADRDALRLKLSGIDAVEGVTFVSSEEALERFRSGVGERSGVLEGLEENPLPASFELTLQSTARNAEGLRAIGEQVSNWEGVDEVGAGAEWIEGYTRVLGILRIGGFALGGTLLVATLLIVANTIRLALYARREEIEILRLVGASPSFVAAPFLIEGLVQGALGGGIAWLTLLGMFYALKPLLAAGLALLLGYIEPVFLGGPAFLAIVSGGSAVGFAGALLAVSQRRSL